MNLMLKQIKTDLHRLANPNKTQVFKSFFKTGKGEYGYGDKFLGVTVPDQRLIAKKYYDQVVLEDLECLLKSPLHEERSLALLILVLRFKKADLKNREKLYKFYLKNISRVNNWDLVDLSAPHIVGAYLFDKERGCLHKFIKSKNLWQRRISVVSTLYFIKNNDFFETLGLVEKVLDDKEDLIHKASGWMLREIGKRDFDVLNTFLKKNYMKMPRTMLRYAIERFPEKLRLAYLRKVV